MEGEDPPPTGVGRGRARGGWRCHPGAWTEESKHRKFTVLSRDGSQVCVRNEPEGKAGVRNFL